MKLFKNLFFCWEIFILLLLAGFIFTKDVKKPFYGHHDWNGVQYANIARNFVRYGFLNTKLGQIESSGLIKKDNNNNYIYNYNTHHPSLLPILISFSFKIFGIHEWPARLVSIFFSLGTILGLYFLGRFLFSRTIGFFIAVFATVPSMMVYFGKMPVHEPLILCWSVWSIYFYTLWIKTKKNKFFTLLLIFTFLNGITGWPGYFLYPIITLHAVTPGVALRLSNGSPRGWKAWRKTLWPWFILAITFSLHLIQTYILTGSVTGGGLLEIFLKRINQETDPVQAAIIGFSWKKYLIQEARWLTIYFTRPLVIVGLLVLLIFLFKIRPWRRQRLDLSKSTILLTLLFALSYPLVFSNAVFIHDYLNIYFLPFFVLSTGWVIFRIEKLFPAKIVFLLSLLLFIFIATERKDFVKALQKSSMHKIGYDLGLAVKQRTNFDEAVLISAPQFAAHFSKFVYFYADRKVGFWEGGVEEFQKEKENLAEKYKYLITVDSMPVSEELKQEFDKMEGQKIREFIFYRIN